MREDIGRGDGGRPEPLELHERHHPGAGGQRARRHRVHALLGWRPGQLHRSGHIQRVSGGSGSGRGWPYGLLPQPVLDVRRVRGDGPFAVRHDIWPRGDATTAP